MTFEDFTKLCGVSHRSPIENGQGIFFVISSQFDFIVFSFI